MMAASPHTERDATGHLLAHIALGLLADGPNHGYALYRDFADTFGPVWRAGRSKFYATLADLQAEGYLGAELEPQEGRPPRKVYHLTDAGRALLLRWLAEPVEAPREVRAAIPVKLHFLDTLGDPATARRLLDAQIATCQARLDQEALRSAHAAPEDTDPFHGLLFEFRRRQLAAMIGWLRYCMARIPRGGPPPR